MDALHLLARELQNNPPPVQVSVKDPERRSIKVVWISRTKSEEHGEEGGKANEGRDGVALPGAIRLKYNDPEIL